MYDASHEKIIRALLDEARATSGLAGDGMIRRIVCGGHLLAAVGERVGLGSRLPPHNCGDPFHEAGLPVSAMELAAGLSRPGAEESALGVAALNSLLPRPANATRAKGQDVILERGQGKNVVVVGHFPFVERLRHEFKSFTVLEKRPRGQDLPAAEFDRVLPEADVVAITGTALTNGTLGELLKACSPRAFVMLLGPSAPLTPRLFDFGVDMLAGAVVGDPETALVDIAAGKPFKATRGTESLVLTRDGA